MRFTPRSISDLMGESVYEEMIIDGILDIIAEDSTDDIGELCELLRRYDAVISEGALDRVRTFIDRAKQLVPQKGKEWYAKVKDKVANWLEKQQEDGRGEEDQGEDQGEDQEELDNHPNLVHAAKDIIRASEKYNNKPSQYVDLLIRHIGFLNKYGISNAEEVREIGKIIDRLTADYSI